MSDRKRLEMTLEERVQYLEILVQAAIWGPYLENGSHRKAIARDLYTRLEAAERHGTFPPALQAALYRFADGLSEIDSQPDALKPVLRPFVEPDD